MRQGHNEQDGGQMTPEEQQIAQAAGEYAKQHRSAIAREVADPQTYDEAELRQILGGENEA